MPASKRVKTTTQTGLIDHVLVCARQMWVEFAMRESTQKEQCSVTITRRATSGCLRDLFLRENEIFILDVPSFRWFLVINNTGLN